MRAPARNDRLPTGIPGLDEVLGGGLIQRDIYLLSGRPGTGKTTLGNQLAHNHARAGGISLFVTVMAEAHERMAAHLAGFAFYGPELVGARLHYVSLYDRLQQDGLSAVLEQLRRLVRQHHATLLVIDGAGMLGRFASSDLEFRQFTFDLQAQLTALGCTSVLLTEHHAQEVEPINTHVDGIVVLESFQADVRAARLVEVVKLRGARHLLGRHEFAITDGGIEVYPRLETIAGSQAPPEAGERIHHPFGVPGLDDMLHGGLLSGTTTLLVGAPGAGKTTAGLHFIAEGARRGEPGIIATFHESPGRLLAKASSIGLELAAHVQAGRVRVLWCAPTEGSVDVWSRDVLGAARAVGARRLFVDAITDLDRLLLFPERLPRYLATFSNELRARDVTALLSAESRTLVSSALEIPISALVDNTVLLRYVELRSQLHRLVSIVKLGESDYDTALREFRITSHGIQVEDIFRSAEAVLTGVARVPGSSAPTSSAAGPAEGR